MKNDLNGMSFETFFNGICGIVGRLLAVLVFRNAITQKDADFINGIISEDEWERGEVK